MIEHTCAKSLVRSINLRLPSAARWHLQSYSGIFTLISMRLTRLTKQFSNGVSPHASA